MPISNQQSKISYRRKPRPRPKTMAEFFAREREVWSELAATWRGLPDEALLRPGACGPGWSVKDVMNHIAAWMKAALRVVPELALGRRAAAGHGVDQFNALHYAEAKDRSLAASRRCLNRARRDLLALVESLPAAQALDVDAGIGRWIKYSTYGHYGEHIHELTQFRERFDRSERRHSARSSRSSTVTARAKEER